MTNGQQQIQGQSNNAPQGGYEYLLRKSEKLTTALYMVTDIMSEKEPLKWKVRESGVDVLSDITLSSISSTSERTTILRNVMKKIERIVSFLDIALTAKMLTEMNVSVLKREYLALRESVEAEWSRIQGAGKPMWNPAFFDVPALPPVAEEKKVTPERVVETTTPEVKPTQETVTAPRPVASAPARNVHTPGAANTAQLHDPFARAFEKERIEPAQQPRPAFTPAVPAQRVQQQQSFAQPRREQPVAEAQRTFTAPAPMNRPPEAARDDRRKIILALLKQKQFLNVNDVAKSLPDVSEKTIQRELLAMVAEGTLIKKGERRWSTYSMRQSQMEI